MVNFMDITQLQAGEKRFGEYLVQIARPTASGWVASIPPISGTITNRRLILVPQTRRPYPPASIPGVYILKATSITLSQRRAVQIQLKIGYILNLFVGWGQGEDFAAHLNMMMEPPPPQPYNPVLSQESVLRMIEQISQL
ncbi:MAG: hypothetical protein CL610_22855 [Anaerolineaceae bacterium]|nr:hypothetical protein [Anaerolineaceae bacterium]